MILIFYNLCKGLPLRLLVTSVKNPSHAIARMYIHSHKCDLLSVHSFFKKKSKLKTAVHCNSSNSLEKVLGKPIVFLLASELCFTRPCVNVP
jgi:hypothetical protein